MTINCNLTEADYRAMRKYAIFRYRKMHWLFAAMLLPLLAFVWFSNKSETTMAVKIASLVVVIMLWVIIFLVLVVAWKLISRFTGGAFRASVGPHVFEIGDEIFTESNAEGRIETRAAGIRHIAETSRHFFIITKTGRGHVIPKKDMESFDAMRLLQSKIGK
jgi:hypothetical protein